ncbi:2-C-methyl-D-erythritol 2,4-cyclodiphosphate synthase [bacterium]|nr:2-C-methyl-D-erythritol 2,4-cyclodiphosphate synthase [bacterium]
MRIGFGYDLHPLVEGRELILGGVHIPFPKGLDGHSDADCLVHAICDAILGAIGKGDIGERFPDSDKRYYKISSILLLEEVFRMARQAGYRIGNLDTTVVAEHPRISPFKEKMAQNLARVLNTDRDRISIKASTTNGLCLFAKDGIAAYAVVCLEERSHLI